MRSTAIVSLLLVAGVLAGCGGDEPEPVRTQPAAPAVPQTPDIQASDRGDGKSKRTNRRRPSALGGADEDKVARRLISKQDVASFKLLEERLGGRLGVVVGPVGIGDTRRQSLGSLRTGRAWATIYVPLAMQLVADLPEDATVPAQTAELMRRAITTSDPRAAAAMWKKLVATHGSSRQAASEINKMFRAASDSTTAVSTKSRGSFSGYGQTLWTLANQQRFIAALGGGCLDELYDADGVLTLMAQTVAQQRWGLGRLSSAAEIKGGSGPGKGQRYLVRQFGLVSTDTSPVAVSIAAEAGDGSASGGERALDEVTRWLDEHLQPGAATELGC